VKKVRRQILAIISFLLHFFQTSKTCFGFSHLQRPIRGWVQSLRPEDGGGTDRGAAGCRGRRRVIKAGPPATSPLALRREWRHDGTVRRGGGQAGSWQVAVNIHSQLSIVLKGCQWVSAAENAPQIATYLLVTLRQLSCTRWF
jgi:hypothetical protein